MTQSLIGLDIGTTHVKAILFSPDARLRGDHARPDGVLHVARRLTPEHRVAGGGAFYLPAELLAAVDAVLADCAQAAMGAGSAVAGIGIASMAEAGVPLDERDRPLGEILAWFDTRSAREAARVRDEIGDAALFAKTGLRPEAKYSLPKLMWWRARRPGAYRRFGRWAGVAELAALALTGELYTNASLAARTLAFDVSRRRWDAELLGLAGLTEQNVPPVLSLGRPTGGLTAQAALRLGLRSGLPVAIAGHDHVIAGLGAGVARPGDALDSMGSAEVALLVTRRPVLTDEVRALGFSSGSHAVDDAAYVLGGLQSAGSAVEWFLDRLAPLVGTAAAGEAPGARANAASTSGRSPANDPDRYAALAALLAGVPAPSDVLVQPYLRGRTAPHPDHEATFAVAGLRERHGAGDLAGGLLDGAAFHIRWMFDELAALTGTRARDVRVVGGGTRNARWLAAKAALSSRPLQIVATEEAAALGAALVAGVASGRFGTIGEALEAATPAEALGAAPDLKRRYERAYRDRWLPWVWPRR